VSRPAERSIASFDSASAMVRASARFLHDEDNAALGVVPRAALPLAERALPLVNRLPVRAREAVYSYGSGNEAVPANRVGDVDADAVAQWMADQFPRRRYPAVVIGSSSGALVHLCAALGIPYLPTTFLLPVRQRGGDPDDPRRGLESGLDPAVRLLDANPDVDLHHMHDPNQDRLSLRRMTYFRIKRRTLGPALTRFLEDRLAPGATIFVSEGRLRWPVTRIGARHVFQFGALGGMDAEEFHSGSARVAEYLRRYGAGRTRWDPPEPDEEAPEAEWGAASVMSAEIAGFAAAHGHPLSTVAFEDPEELSPPVAELLRWWQRAQGRQADRLLVESFVLLDPWWTQRLGLVPLWLKFGVDSSADALERYLDATDPFDEIRVALFSHGTEGVGVAPAGRWRALAGRARRKGALIGVDARRFPRDFASFVRFWRELRKLQPQVEPPATLPIAAFERYAERAAGWTIKRAAVD
jgi:hypothetical protein